MNIITSNAHFRQRVIKKSYKTGGTAAARYYKISRKQLAKYHKKCNDIPKICLGFKTPKEVIAQYLVLCKDEVGHYIFCGESVAHH